MKVTQSKNYRKPLYAIGLAAAIAVTVTACGNEPVQLMGDTTVAETTEDVQLAGDVEFFDPDATVEFTTEDTTEATT